MITINNICKSFENRTVLDNISTTFETGKTNLIIGQSGSGKTVLLKSLVRSHKNGVVLLDKGIVKRVWEMDRMWEWE